MKVSDEPRALCGNFMQSIMIYSTAKTSGVMVLARVLAHRFINFGRMLQVALQSERKQDF
jgi:hypothetical protein